jgi:hypothetical protein
MLVIPVAEQRLGSRWTVVGFFAGDLLGSVPVLLGTRVAAALGFDPARLLLHEVDGGTSAGSWALIAALVVTLPAGRWRRWAGAALAVCMVGGLVLDQGIADVQHAVSVLGVVLVLTVGRRVLEARRGPVGSTGVRAEAPEPVTQDAR